MGDHVADESHVVFIEFTFFDLGVEFVVSQDLQNGSDVRDMESGVLGEDDDVVENANRRQIEVLT